MTRKYEVIFPEQGHDWTDATIVQAHDAQQAAEEASEHYDGRWADYPACRKVLVRLLLSQDVQAFTVTLEAVPSYTAHEVQP